VFRWQRKVIGKKVEGKIVRGKKVEGKWVESKIIFWLFGMSESEKNIRGKKDIFLLNDINTLMCINLCI
jgi:hypothetical protein